jgi:hypothetical protein
VPWYEIVETILLFGAMRETVSSPELLSANPKSLRQTTKYLPGFISTSPKRKPLPLLASLSIQFCRLTVSFVEF